MQYYNGIHSFKNLFINIYPRIAFSRYIQIDRQIESLQDCRPRSISCVWCTIRSFIIYTGPLRYLSFFVRNRSAPRGVAGGVNPRKARMHQLVKRHIVSRSASPIHGKSQIPVATYTILCRYVLHAGAELPYICSTGYVLVRDGSDRCLCSDRLSRSTYIISADDVCSDDLRPG